MSEKESLQGLSCPKCGGMVPIPEGQAIVQCPFCNLRSFVKGERGLRRYQAPQKVNRQGTLQALRQFFSSSLAIARDAPRQAQVSEAFLVYLPFWTVWSRTAGWVFGLKQVGSGDHRRYQPREVKIVEEMTWDGAACDVGEFGVTNITLAGQTLEPFNPDTLHASGLVFEPMGAFSEAKAAAESDFQERVRRRAGLDKISQIFIRLLRPRYGLVYYPLWVLRYLYRGRAFQVVVDAFSGQVLYGKAPGRTLYRAAVLVLGMALGAFLAVDASSAVFSLSSRNSDNSALFGLALIAVGLGVMGAAYRAFRYGEQYEYRRGGSRVAQLLGQPIEMLAGDFNVRDMMDLEKWVERLN